MKLEGGRTLAGYTRRIVGIKPDLLHQGCQLCIRDAIQKGDHQRRTAGSAGVGAHHGTDRACIGDDNITRHGVSRTGRTGTTQERQSVGILRGTAQGHGQGRPFTGDTLPREVGGRRSGSRIHGGRSISKLGKRIVRIQIGNGCIVGQCRQRHIPRLNQGIVAAVIDGDGGDTLGGVYITDTDRQTFQSHFQVRQLRPTDHRNFGRVGGRCGTITNHDVRNRITIDEQEVSERITAAIGA